MNTISIGYAKAGDVVEIIEIHKASICHVRVLGWRREYYVRMENLINKDDELAKELYL